MVESQGMQLDDKEIVGIGGLNTGSFILEVLRKGRDGLHG